MVSCFARLKKEDILCRFCGAPDNDGHLFWDCTFHPFVELRNNPEFLPLMNRDRTSWPRCLLWHGWASWADFQDFRFSLGYCI